jgi:hypothetical protein
MAFRAGLLNFSKGEIAEELIARVDVPSYNAALKKARNVVVLKYGGVAKRPGTRLVARAHDQENPVRLLPFQFSLTQAYVLEMGDQYMRPEALGGVVLEQALTITAITRAGNAQVTAAYHGYDVGDEVYFNDVSGMAEINGRIANVVSVVDDHNFTVNINTSGFSAFVSDAGGIARPDPPPPPSPPPTESAPDPVGSDPVPVGPGGGFTYTGGDGSTLGGHVSGGPIWLSTVSSI